MRPDVYDFTQGSENPETLEAFVLAMTDVVDALEDASDLLRPHSQWTAVYALLIPVINAARAELDEAGDDLEDVEMWHARRIAAERDDEEAMRIDSYRW